MNKYSCLESQGNLDNLLSEIDWEDSFIKEGHLASPSYLDLEKKGIIAAESTILARVLVCTPYSQYEGVEFLFEGSEDFYLPCNVDLEPSGVWSNSCIEFRFSGTKGPYIKARNVYYQMVECRGWSTKYAKENIFDEGGILKIE